MAWWPVIASVAGSLISSMGQEDTNDTNLQIQQQNSAFNAEQAQLNRDFQQRNADTVWQRGTADMQAAGLNPMLAYSQGGNPAPAGGSATSGTPGNMQNPFANAGQSAAQWAQIENTQAQTEKTRAETKVVQDQMREWDDENGGWKQPKSWQGASEQHRGRELWYRGSKLIEEIGVTREQEKLIKEQIKNAVDTGENIRADTRDTTANAVLRELAKEEAKNKSTHQLKYPGYNVDVKPFIGDINSVINSAAGATGKFRPSPKHFHIGK